MSSSLAPINVGLVGLGSHVRENLLPHLMVHHDVVVAAWSDPFVQGDMVPAALRAAELPTWENVVDRADAVIVAGPPSLHFEVAAACLELGKPVLVEKPVAPSRKHATLLVKASEGSSTLIDAGLNFAHSFAVARVADEIREAGGVETLSISYVAKGGAQSRWGLPAQESLLLSHGAHAVDLAVLWSRSAVADVSATWRENAVFATLEFESGTLAHLEIITGAPRFYLDYRLTLRDGSLALGQGVRTVERAGMEGRAARRIASWQSSLVDSAGGAAGYRVEIGAFIASIRNGDTRSDAFYRAVEGMQILEKLLAFSRDGPCSASQFA